MGGYGALSLAMHRPDVFAAVYAMSPCCLAWVAELTRDSAASWRRAVRFRDPRELRTALGEGDFLAVAFVSMAAAFSPNRASPIGVDLPFALDGDRLVPAEPGHSAWRRAFLIEQLPERARGLAGLRGIGFDVGTADEIGHIPIGARAFSRALEAAGVPHFFKLYRGTHSDRIGERLEDAALPFLGRALTSGGERAGRTSGERWRRPAAGPGTPSP
jgi:S-formylglutathione hydrolase FrmB